VAPRLGGAAPLGVEPLRDLDEAGVDRGNEQILLRCPDRNRSGERAGEVRVGGDWTAMQPVGQDRSDTVVLERHGDVGRSLVDLEGDVPSAL
jgi:hypothetical protein